MSIIEKAAARLNRQKASVAEPDKGAPLSGVMPALDAGTSPATPAVDADASAAKVNQSVIHDSAAVSAPAHALDVSTPTPGKEATRPRKPNRKIEINFSQLHQLGMVTPNAARTAIADEFRLIKRPLIDKAFGSSSGVKNGNLIMVTSSLPGEGKTFTAINLAISIATEMDHTVLLVDADVARPSVPKTLGFESEAGLMDVLLGENLKLSDVMLTTNLERLRILPAGRSHRHATELLASQAMSNLLNEIASRYPDRIVIFDSPPLLATTEARVLAGQMGQIVLVVEAEGTTQGAVKEAIRQVGSCANVNLVYNKARSFSGRAYYGSYY